MKNYSGIGCEAPVWLDITTGDMNGESRYNLNACIVSSTTITMHGFIKTAEIPPKPVETLREAYNLAHERRAFGSPLRSQQGLGAMRQEQLARYQGGGGRCFYCGK